MDSEGLTCGPQAPDPASTPPHCSPAASKGVSGCLLPPPVSATCSVPEGSPWSYGSQWPGHLGEPRDVAWRCQNNAVRGRTWPCSAMEGEGGSPMQCDMQPRQDMAQGVCGPYSMWLGDLQPMALQKLDSPALEKLPIMLLNNITISPRLIAANLALLIFMG